MNIFEQKQVLKTFEILVDSREQDTERARKRYSSFGVPYRRATLSYGDYAYNATLLNNTPFLMGHSSKTARRIIYGYDD